MFSLWISYQPTIKAKASPASGLLRGAVQATFYSPRNHRAASIA